MDDFKKSSFLKYVIAIIIDDSKIMYLCSYLSQVITSFFLVLFYRMATPSITLWALPQQ